MALVHRVGEGLFYLSFVGLHFRFHRGDIQFLFFCVVKRIANISELSGSSFVFQLIKNVFTNRQESRCCVVRKMTKHTKKIAKIISVEIVFKFAVGLNSGIRISMCSKLPIKIGRQRCIYLL